MINESKKAKFYDHASNHTTVAEASAVARVRRESIATGTAYRVEFINSKGEAHYWDGGLYDSLYLAKSLVLNRYAGVSLIRPDGSIMDAEQIKNARY